MKSGVAFSAIFIIWITAAVVAFYLLFPDINNSINSINNLNLDDSELIVNEETIKMKSLTNYSPLAIFDLGL